MRKVQVIDIVLLMQDTCATKSALQSQQWQIIGIGVQHIMQPYIADATIQE